MNNHKRTRTSLLRFAASSSYAPTTGIENSFDITATISRWLEKRHLLSFTYETWPISSSASVATSLAALGHRIRRVGGLDRASSVFYQKKARDLSRYHPANRAKGSSEQRCSDRRGGEGGERGGDGLQIEGPRSEKSRGRRKRRHQRGSHRGRKTNAYLPVDLAATSALPRSRGWQGRARPRPTRRKKEDSPAARKSSDSSNLPLLASTPFPDRFNHLRPPPSLDRAGTTPPLPHLDRPGPTRLQARRRLCSPLRPRPTSASHAQPGRNTPASEAVCFQGIAPLPTWIFDLVTRRPTQATRRRPQRSRQASA
jgi:hypothetical protein